MRRSRENHHFPFMPVEPSLRPVEAHRRQLQIFTDGDPDIVEGRAAAHVGFGLRGEPVDVAAIGAEFGPPDGGGEEGAGDDVGGDAGCELHPPVFVFQNDCVALLDAARAGVVGMNPDQGLAFAAAEAFEIGEGGVEEVVGGGRDEGERLEMGGDWLRFVEIGGDWGRFVEIR